MNSCGDLKQNGVLYVKAMAVSKWRSTQNMLLSLFCYTFRESHLLCYWTRKVIFVSGHVQTSDDID
jgi:hypothetical protein